MHPKQSLEAVKEARRLWSDDSTTGTIAAVVLVVIFVGWPLYRLRKATRGGR